MDDIGLAISSRGFYLSVAYVQLEFRKIAAFIWVWLLIKCGFYTLLRYLWILVSFWFGCTSHRHRQTLQCPSMCSRSTPCYSAKKERDDQWAEVMTCANGDSCVFSHSRPEQQLHPDVSPAGNVVSGIFGNKPVVFTAFKRSVWCFNFFSFCSYHKLFGVIRVSWDYFLMILTGYSFFQSIPAHQSQRWFICKAFCSDIPPASSVTKDV